MTVLYCRSPPVLSQYCAASRKPCRIRHFRARLDAVVCAVVWRRCVSGWGWGCKGWWGGGVAGWVKPACVLLRRGYLGEGLHCVCLFIRLWCFLGEVVVCRERFLVLSRQLLVPSWMVRLGEDCWIGLSLYLLLSRLVDYVLTSSLQLSSPVTCKYPSIRDLT